MRGWGGSVVVATMGHAWSGSISVLTKKPVNLDTVDKNKIITWTRQDHNMHSVLTIVSVSIYRLISMYNGSDSNTSAHTRFAKPLKTRRTSHMVRQAMELEFDCLKQGERAANVLLDSERCLQKTMRDRNCN